MPPSTISIAVTTPENLGAPKLTTDGSPLLMSAFELSALIKDEAEKMVRQIMEAKEKEA
jgi:hypothetical protein